MKFYNKVFYMMPKALSGKLSYTGTVLVSKSLKYILDLCKIKAIIKSFA